MARTAEAHANARIARAHEPTGSPSPLDILLALGKLGLPVAPVAVVDLPSVRAMHSWLDRPNLLRGFFALDVVLPLGRPTTPNTAAP